MIVFKKALTLGHIIKIIKATIICSGYSKIFGEDSTEESALKSLMNDFAKIETLKNLRLLDLYVNFNITN